MTTNTSVALSMRDIDDIVECLTAMKAYLAIMVVDNDMDKRVVEKRKDQCNQALKSARALSLRIRGIK